MYMIINFLFQLFLQILIYNIKNEHFLLLFKRKVLSINNQ